MEKLEALAELLPKPSGEIVEVDVSRFFSTEKPVVLRWKRPSVAEIYVIASDAQQLMKLYMWQSVPRLAFHVATMAVCHADRISDDLPPGKFYAMLAQHDELFLFLLTKLGEHFPHLLDVASAGNESADGA